MSSSADRVSFRLRLATWADAALLVLASVLAMADAAPGCEGSCLGRQVKTLVSIAWVSLAAALAVLLVLQMRRRGNAGKRLALGAIVRRTATWTAALLVVWLCALALGDDALGGYGVVVILASGTAFAFALVALLVLGATWAVRAVRR